MWRDGGGEYSREQLLVLHTEQWCRPLLEANLRVLGHSNCELCAQQIIRRHGAVRLPQCAHGEGRVEEKK